MSRVAVAIMSANTDSCRRNEPAIINTYINYSKEIETNNEYVFYFYVGGSEFKKEQIDEGVYKITVETGDGIHDTFEKSIKAFEYIRDNEEFDYFVRLNTSTYFNVWLFDRVCNTIGDNIYCNCVNAVLCEGKYTNMMYPRGDFYVMSRENFEKVLAKADFVLEERETLTHVDDVMFGACIIEALGKTYFEHIVPVRYSYIPGNVSDIQDMLDPLSIGVRLKSVAKGSYSGAWGDFNCRKNEPNKFNTTFGLMSSGDYNEFIESAGIKSIEDLVSKDKPIIVIQYTETTYDNLIRYYKKGVS